MTLHAPVDAPAALASDGGREPSRAFGWAIFLGAFLLFEVQLVLAKALLPWFGGAPAVWTTCMLFFQVLLLAGYGYAHALVRRLTPRAQALVHLGLLVLAASTLPVLPDAPSGDPGATPVRAILVLLGSAVALPYLALSASSPLLSAWFVLGSTSGGAAPYRLYALSNAGSMLALLAYPLAVEPWLTTHGQDLAWSLAFGAYALLVLACARGVWSSPARPVRASGPRASTDERGPTLRERLVWLLLPMCAAILLLAVTNQLCQEVAVVPLLWVVPLALYLASFTVTFESDRWYRRSWSVPVLILTLVVLAETTTLGARAGILFALPVYSIGLFVLCLFCHGELAARRPAARHLTAFYLWIALGGALGGVFVSLLAPLVFRGFDELYVGLLLCSVLAAALVFRDPAYRRARGPWHPLLVSLLLVTGVLGLLVGARLALSSRRALGERRDFYGTLHVSLEELVPGDAASTVKTLTHGRTPHGKQFQSAELAREPITYFGRESGIGLLLAELAGDAPLAVGIIGLGAGTLAAYGRAGDTYRFYELSALVIEVAREQFTFLASSPARIEVVPGDARLSLAREAPNGYDVLVLDAFSSDAIPVHLLTQEALALYARHVRPGGVLALHLTTRHLDLGPLVQGLAHAAGKLAFEIRSAADGARGLLDARWILVTDERALLARARLAAAGELLAHASVPRPWTDDYSNLLQVLK